MNRELKIYTIEYASGMFNKKAFQTQLVYSKKKLNVGDFIVVEHVGFGVFIGKVAVEYIDDRTDEDILEDIKYRYVQDIDLSSYIDSVEKEKRKEELKIKMKERFAVIDEDRKFQYYADLDDELKKMYDEYKEL